MFLKRVDHTEHWKAITPEQLVSELVDAYGNHAGDLIRQMRRFGVEVLTREARYKYETPKADRAQSPRETVARPKETRRVEESAKPATSRAAAEPKT